MDDDEYTYFAYGSNLHPRRLESRIGRCAHLKSVKINQYKLEFDKLSTDGSAKCNIVDADQNDCIYGALYTITASQKKILDRFEAGYSTIWIDIQNYSRSFTYKANPPFDRLSLPFDWYKILVIMGAAYHAFPTTYLNMLGSVRGKSDEDRKRAEDNLKIFY